MPRAHPITGVGGLTSETWYAHPPVEAGRADASVTTIAVGTATGDNGTGGGSNGAVANKATTTDGNGSNLVVDLTIAGNVCTVMEPDTADGSDGDGYRIGDKVTVAASDSGTSTAVVGYVTSLNYEN